jgi:hypothetical protein
MLNRQFAGTTTVTVLLDEVGDVSAAATMGLLKSASRDDLAIVIILTTPAGRVN